MSKFAIVLSLLFFLSISLMGQTTYIPGDLTVGGDGGVTTKSVTGQVVSDFNPYLQGNSLISDRSFPIERIVFRGSSTFIESSQSNYITDELLVLTIMQRFKTNVLFQAGYNTINICDGWWLGRNQTTGKIEYNPTNFPHGIRWLMDTLHSNGFYGVLYYDDKGVPTVSPSPGPHKPTFDVADLGIITSENFSNDCVTFRDWNIDGLQWDNRRYDSGRARYNTTGWSYWLSTLCPNIPFISYGSSLTNADWVTTIPENVSITPDPYNGYPKVITNKWNGVDTYVQAHKLPQWRINCSDAAYFFGDNSSFEEYIDWQEASSPFWTGKRPVFAMAKLSGQAVTPSFGDEVLAAEARFEHAFISTFHQPFDIVGTSAFVVGLNPFLTNETLQRIQRDEAMNTPKRFWTSNTVSAWYEHLNDGSIALLFWNRATNDTTWSYPSIPLSLLGIQTNSPQYVYDVFFQTNCYVVNNFGTQLTNHDARLYIIQPSNTVYVVKGSTGVYLNGNPPPDQLGTVGQYSFGVGTLNTPSGIGAFTAGGGNTASGNYSVAVGNANVASGADSFVAGGNNTAAGTLSTVLGNQNYAAGGGYNFAIGLQANVTGAGSFELNGGAYGPKTNSVNFKLQVDGYSSGVVFSDPMTVSNLTVNTAITIGTTNTAPVAGTIKYENAHFYGWNGSTWLQLDN